MKKIIIVIVIVLMFLTVFANTKTDIITFFEQHNIPHWLIVMLVSMLPIFELRGGIPIAINLFNMNIISAYFLCLLGNIIPVIPILLLLEKLYELFSRWKITKHMFDSFFERTKSRSQQVERYKMLGLIAFVAIPLPITGAWTGAAAAVLFNISFRHALISIIIGVMIAGIIVTLLSVIGIWGAIIAGAAILLSIVYPLFKTKL